VEGKEAAEEACCAKCGTAGFPRKTGHGSAD